MRIAAVTLTRWLIAALGACSVGHAAEPVVSREDELKAAYLFNFAKFVEWPTPGETRALTFCVRASDSLGTALRSTVADKKIGPRGIAVRSLQPVDSEAGCDALYLAAESVPDSLAIRRISPILTISDAAGFVERGGMIEMFAAGNRIRFNINAESARRAGLKISSNLLRLASRVEPSSP